MEIYQHFREEEKPFIDQVLAWQSDVEMRFQRKLTDFLNPREQYIFNTITSQGELVTGLFGGYGQTERKRAIIAPEYETLGNEEFQVVLLEADYPDKFITIEHRDVLGAFMSLGIRRDKIGDMNVRDGKAQIIAAEEISDYLRMNLNGIKKASVTFTEKPLQEFMENGEQWAENDTTLSSLRLDILVKEIYGMSRKKASMHIEGGLVKVNFRTVESPSFLLETGDLISVRGKGRSKIKDIHGKTKKDKIKVTTAKLM
ncbi:RNA-binding protein [Halobacillus salinarum]|uniref:RNA-binding protein n=1 Tax=Halobacillus salinarum TaxID=2932257 RepID=A0ABY4ELY8_9BACI|nr:RNA-binding protein [Halobacillus salinarum]UOQ43121.1 RNA-binding protein [Halobacillus salinarum]